MSEIVRRCRCQKLKNLMWECFRNMFFNQSLVFQGINVHSEDLLRNPSFVKRAKSKGLVIFSWGDDANDPDNRKKLREYGVHGLIYDRYLIVL